MDFVVSKTEFRYAPPAQDQRQSVPPESRSSRAIFLVQGDRPTAKSPAPFLAKIFKDQLVHVFVVNVFPVVRIWE